MPQKPIAGRAAGLLPEHVRRQPLGVNCRKAQPCGLGPGLAAPTVAAPLGQALGKVEQGIVVAAADNHFEVQVGAGGATGGAHQANLLAS